MSAPVGAFSVFPLAAAVTAPAGALPVFPHCRSSDCSPQERYLYFPTAAAVSAPAGALSIFPHCRSSARSSRSFFFSSRPLPSPSPNPPPLPFPTAPCHPGTVFFTVVPALAGAFPYFPTAAAVSAPAGAPSISPHCRSSVYPHLLLPLPTLPQQHTSAEAASSSKMPQHHFKRCQASHQP